MRLPLLVLVLFAALPAQAQYAPNSTGIGLMAVPGNETLRLDPQLGIGLGGTRQIGVGSWSWMYRGVIAVTQAVDDPSRATLIPAWVSTGLRYDLSEDRLRPFAILSGTYYQLTNPPAGFTAGVYMAGAGLRLGVEQYLATEISVQFDVGGSWFLQLDSADPLIADAVLGLKVHY
ncbi:MAG: hypothetical protein OSB21_03190 [Myxococcota bacterium]|nr:hypothetical protein [Myxococcota bacterium]